MLLSTVQISFTKCCPGKRQEENVEETKPWLYMVMALLSSVNLWPVAYLCLQDIQQQQKFLEMF